ncbi:caspase family protein [Streptomyces sp. NPDC059837]|uniref:caspase family protein n=1 Tax=Streptomyces sp. NPDC059837 TaxID=3346968 RepID=UPI00365FA9D1
MSGVSRDVGAGDNDGPRRFLIATAMAHYSKSPEWNRPSLVEARDQIIELFTGELGYRHETDLGLNPTKAQLADQLRAFSKSPDRREDDLLAVYISGHGEVLDGDEHVLLTADTDPNDVDYTALPTAELARAILRGTSVRRLLLVLDTCYSGQGGNDTAATALKRISAEWGQAAGSGLVIVSSAQPHQQAQAGLFPRLLSDAVGNRATAGHGPRALPVDMVVKQMNAHPALPKHQRISLAMVGLTGEVPEFFANPRYGTWLTDVDLAIQDAAEFDEQARRRDTELTRRLLVHAMGYPGDAAEGWWFCGRHAVLADLAKWLQAPAADGHDCRVVTAGPGSGKTAVLGLIAALAHPERRRTVPVGSLGLAPSLVPDAETVDVAVYAQNLTDIDVLNALAAAARVRANTVGELLKALEARGGERPFTALIDALDEAATPDTLCTQILKPLINYSHGRIRLLLGTRPDLLDSLGMRPSNNVGSGRIINLDDSRYADPEALTAYTVRTLIEAHPNSPYRRGPEALRPVAEAVAAAAGPSFLVARITAGTLAAAEDVVADPQDPAWRASLPRHAGQAMREDLVGRLGEDAQRATDLLRPLAFAQGQGLPWEDIWALAASQISGRSYTDDDVVWLRGAAGSYVVEATESDRSAYRLYHQALAEHLRDGINAQAVHTAVAEILTARVPYLADGTREWARAHPYALNHLATHAAEAGRLDEVLGDTEYLIHAATRSLTPHLQHARSDTARLTAAVYRTSAGPHSTDTASERRQVLALDAARAGATALRQQLIDHTPEGHWTPRWATGSGFTPALRDTLTGHTGPVSEVACTNLDGAPVAVTGDDDGVVRVWDMRTGTPIGQPLTGHAGPVQAVACTNLDGAPVAVTGDDEVVRVWDLRTGTPLRQPLTGHTGPVQAAACTNLDGAPVAVTGGHDRRVRVWDLRGGTLLGQPLTGTIGSVTVVACTEMGEAPVAVTGGSDGMMRVWDLRGGTLLGQPLTGAIDGVRSMACTELDGTPIAVTGDGPDGVLAWDLRTGTPIGQPQTGDTRVNAVACTELDGTPILVTGDDGVVRVWDLRTGTPIGQPLTGHTGPVQAVACAKVDGAPVAVTGDDGGVVRVWDLRAGTPIGRPLTGHTGPVHAVACAEVDGVPVAVICNGGMVRVWDLRTGISFGQLQGGHSIGVSAVACTNLDGVPVAVTGEGAGRMVQVRVWDLRTGTPIGQPLTGHTGLIRAVACTEVDGVTVAVTSSRDGTVRIWDLRGGVLLGQPLTDHMGGMRSVACTEVDGAPVVVTGSDTGVVRVWDLRTGTRLGSLLNGDNGGVRSMACAKVDGVPVAVTGDGPDGRVRVWDLRTGTPIGQPQGGEFSVTAVACTKVNGIPVTVIGNGGVLRVWDLRSGTPIGRPLTGHTEPVLAVACAEVDGGPVAVTGDAGGVVRVWDLGGGAFLGQPATGHANWVEGVACTEVDGVSVAVTGSRDGTVRVWDLRDGTPIGQPLTGHTNWMRAVTCTEMDGVPVAVICDNTRVRVWDLRDGVPIGRPLTSNTGGVGAVACTEVDGVPVAVTGWDDGRVRVWDLRTGTLIGSALTGHSGGVNAVACTEVDGAPVTVIGSHDGMVRVWDLRGGALLGQPLTGHTGPVRTVACTQVDGTPVAVAGGGMAQMWDLRSGTLIGQPLTGHSGGVGAVACTEMDGVPVAVSTDNGTVRVWNLRTGKPAEVLRIPNPSAVAVTFGGDLVVGMGNDVAVFNRRTLHRLR